MDSYLGSLSEVGGQFKARDDASVIPHYDDGVNGVEFNVSELDSVRHHSLLAQGFKLVNVEVKNMDLKQDEHRKEFTCFRLDLSRKRVKQTMEETVQINAVR